jgi:hypothetical protein
MQYESCIAFNPKSRLWSVISEGSIVVPHHVVTFLRLDYGMSGDFLRAQTDSWIAWLEAQRLANSAPHDAMRADSFCLLLEKLSLSLLT